MYRTAFEGLLLLAFVSANGCAQSPSDNAARPKPEVQSVVERTGSAPRPSAEPQDVPPDAARKAAHDWPGFLGPSRNGKSAERGLSAEFPAAGPPVVWQTAVGTGY